MQRDEFESHRELIRQPVCGLDVIANQRAAGVDERPRHRIVEVTHSKDATILVPYGGGFHEYIGVELALRLAQASGATITLIGPAAGAEEAHQLAARAGQAYGDTGVWTIPAPVPAEVRAEAADAVLRCTRALIPTAS